MKYEKGILRPLDHIEFREGEELEVMIIRRNFSGFQEEASKYRFKIEQNIVEEFVKERR